MIKRASILYLVFVLLACLCSCGQQAPTWQEQYDLGVRYLSEGNYEEAIIAFTAAIEIDPKQALAYVGRGDAYIASEGTKENMIAAQTDYEKAVGLDETLEDAYIGLANSLICQGNYDDALSVLQKCTDTRGENQKAAEMIRNMSKIMNSAKAALKENQITVLTKQSVIRYERVNDTPGLINDGVVYTNYLYQYNDQGYLVHEESMSRKEAESEWEKSLNFDDWSYNPETMKWTHTFCHNGKGDITSEEIESYSPGARSYTTGENGSVCITTDPYPDGTPFTDYNADYGSLDRVDWYFANYTYDEDGNAIFIESYSKDEQLLGTCELEWKTIELPGNPEESD